MMLACEPEGQSFGWALPDWQGGKVPNTLIVRQDREPLSTEIVEAFGDSCQDYLQPAFERATELLYSNQFATLQVTGNQSLIPLVVPGE